MKREDVLCVVHGLARLHERAADLGWHCLSDVWRGSKAGYTFECAKGHRFERHASTILRYSPECPECRAEAIRQRFYARLEECGFICHEVEYLGGGARHRFQCGAGHEWMAMARKIMEGHGCPACAHAATAVRRTCGDGLERMRRLAAGHGGRCLAERYEGASARYQWECSSGHRWEATAANVVQGHWCRQCAARLASERHLAPDGLVRLQAMAASHGGACLEDRYLGSGVRHRFRCAHGHEWRAEAGGILRGNWCRPCAARRHGEAMLSEDGMERLRTAAASQGGRCLAETYMGLHARYDWECIRGHRWSSTGQSVVRGHWCRWCGAASNNAARRDPDGLVQLQAVAASHGGQCLDETWLGTSLHYRFRCANGHEWRAEGSHVLRGTWCKHCANRRRRLTIGQMEEIARERGGRCLSAAYLGNKVKLTWECNRGHVWDATPVNITSKGRWCPTCAILRRTRKRQKRLKWDYEGRE